MGSRRPKKLRRGNRLQLGTGGHCPRSQHRTLSFSRGSLMTHQNPSQCHTPPGVRDELLHLCSGFKNQGVPRIGLFSSLLFLCTSSGDRSFLCLWILYVLFFYQKVDYFSSNLKSHLFAFFFLTSQSEVTQGH